MWGSRNSAGTIYSISARTAWSRSLWCSWRYGVAAPSTSVSNSVGASWTSVLRCSASPREACSSNLPSILATRSCVTAHGPANGHTRRPRHCRAIPTRGVKVMGKLEGKIAVVTGGNSGIGLATAEAFVVEGAHVVVTGRRQAELDAAVAHIGSNVTAVQGDVSKPEDLDRLIAKSSTRRGK